MKIWILLKLTNDRSCPATHWVTSSSHNSTIATYGNDGHMEHLHIPELKMRCAFLNYKNLSLAAALFSNRFFQVLPQHCPLQTPSSTSSNKSHIASTLHILVFTQPSRVPLESNLRTGQFVSLQHTVYSPSQHKPPIFIMNHFFPKPGGSLRCCSSVSDTFSARWEQLWSRSSFLTTVT